MHSLQQQLISSTCRRWLHSYRSPFLSNAVFAFDRQVCFQAAPYGRFWKIGANHLQDFQRADKLIGPARANAAFDVNAGG